MKANFIKGEGQVQIEYKIDAGPKHTKSDPIQLRSTVLTVTLPGCEPLTTKVSCHTGDQFCRRVGRHYAFLKLIDIDNEQARDQALSAHSDELLKRKETNEGLDAAARKFYKISREDRKVLFHITCPEYFSNTPERKALREKALLARLKDKYESECLPKGKTININQVADKVVGTMIGAVINNGQSVDSKPRKAAK